MGQNVNEQAKLGLSGRERELQIVDGFLKREPAPSKPLLFLGSPRIGKTYLLNRIVEHIETELSKESRNFIALRIPCNEKGIWDRNQDTYYSWPILRLWLRNKLEEQLRKQEQGAAFKDELMELFQTNHATESRDQWELFFSKLKEIVPNTIIIFILDDMDKAWPTSERYSKDALLARDFANFATSSNVEVLASARTPGRFPAEDYWLGLLEKDDALVLINRLLRNEQAKADELTSAIFEQAGHHPFLITELCNFILNDRGAKNIKDTISNWQSSDLIQEFLNELCSYINDYTKIGIVNIDVGLKRILHQEGLAGCEAEVSLLEKWGMIWKHDDQLSISSALLKRTVENWSTGNRAKPSKWNDTFWQYWDMRTFFWSTYISTLAALISIGLFRSLGTFNANIAVLWFLIPFLYAIYGLIGFGLKTSKNKVK